MNKLSTERFTWSIEPCELGYNIHVSDIEQNRFKQFFTAGVLDNAKRERVNDFMNSMTDDLLDGYWPKERLKKPKKSAEVVLGILS